MADIEVYKRTLKRERAARREAEQLLEKKSLELYNTLEALKGTAAELRDEAEKTRAVLSTAAEGILTFAADGTIESVNPAAERIFDTDASAMIGNSLRAFLPTTAESPHAEAPDEEWWTPAPGDPSDSRSAFGKRSSGEVFEMELSASRVQLEDRWIYTWIVRDVSARRNLERRLAVAQRLESVGALAAGVAHEINTPIQFVGDNLAFMQQAVTSWMELHQKYQQLHKEAQAIEDLAPLCEAIAAQAEASDMEFLHDELPVAIEQSVEGASRVAKIVRAMKEFSHPGGADKVPMDLNQAIESTLTVSRNEWKYVADVQTELDPELPVILCYPGDLNQALLNLIVNAAQAIAEVSNDGPNEPGTITISTSGDENEVEIKIVDNGPGIPPEIQERIYDPFFTTKAVGVGTGQGLSIVHAVIVERHQGSLRMESTSGQGTTFTIRLPIHGKQAQPDENRQVTGHEQGDRHADTTSLR